MSCSILDLEHTIRMSPLLLHRKQFYRTFQLLLNIFCVKDIKSVTRSRGVVYRLRCDLFRKKHYLCLSAPAMPLPPTAPQPGPGQYEVTKPFGEPKHFMSVVTIRQQQVFRSPNHEPPMTRTCVCQQKETQYHFKSTATAEKS